MTNPETPTAPEALVAAWQIVKLPCSAAETERAKVLLGIAIELRQAADIRAIRARYELAPRLRSGGVLREPAPQQPDAGSAERTQVMLSEAPIDVSKWAASLAAAETQVVADPGTTQRLPVVWSVGDKADCRHCHTPIELVEAETTGLKADAVKLWRHKYTGQATCVDPSFATGRDTAIVHTFAEPEPRG